MTGLTEETAQALVRQLAQANALRRLELPAEYSGQSLIDHYDGRSLDWIREQAARLIGYRRRRGVQLRLTRAQVLRLDHALERDAATDEHAPPDRRRAR